MAKKYLREVWCLILCFNLVRPCYLDIWPNTSLGVTFKVFLDEINIKISILWGEQITSIMWVDLVQWVEGLKTDWAPLRKRKFCFYTVFALELQHKLFPGSPACWPTLQIWGLPVYTVTWVNSIPSFLFLWRTLSNTGVKHGILASLYRRWEDSCDSRWDYLCLWVMGWNVAKTSVDWQSKIFCNH